MRRMYINFLSLGDIICNMWFSMLTNLQVERLLNKELHIGHFIYTYMVLYYNLCFLFVRSLFSSQLCIALLDSYLGLVVQ